MGYGVEWVDEDSDDSRVLLDSVGKDEDGIRRPELPVEESIVWLVYEVVVRGIVPCRNRMDV